MRPAVTSAGLTGVARLPRTAKAKPPGPRTVSAVASRMPRNLIVIVGDTLRHPRYIPTFDGQPAMPFLDEVARQGASLGRLVASSSWTCPSHASLLTGVDTWETHFYLSATHHSMPKVTSLAEKWRARGGVSVAFSGNFLVAPEIGTAPGYDAYNPGLLAKTAGAAQQGLTTIGYERLLHRVERRLRSHPRPGLGARASASAVEFLGTGLYQAINQMRRGTAINAAMRRALRGLRDGRPVHLFVNFAEPHEPYLLRQAGESRINVGHLPSINLARHIDYLAPAGQGEQFRRAYVASVRELDRQLRTAFTTFERAGLLRDAVVLFVADHGQSLGEHDFYGHGHYLYDELLEVPGFLLEYRDGQRVPLTSPDTDWIDLRHVHDLLASVAPDGDALDPGPILAESLARRGPAASYWEGPLPRSPRGFLYQPARSEIYRLLRVRRGDRAAMVTDGGKDPAPRALPEENGSPADPELAALGTTYLGRARAEPSAEGASTLAHDVDERLKSWGYD